MIRTGSLLAAAVALSLLSPAEIRAEQRVIGTFTDWTAFVDQENGNRLCYIGSAPQKEEGDYTRRGNAYMLVTIRPQAHSHGVVTVEAGYPYRPGSTVSVAIDGNTFELYTRNRDGDGLGDAWAFGDDGDKALVQAMRAGRTMVVKGTSSRGTLTTDTYSLLGFTAAYNAMEQACRG
ncbi:MAG: hypothetical protein EA406_04820 [Rhodospirillales bacterium]|nr:MAG: hypothetical protein EA406_04820 [Rhodospirillales bacterium]